MGAMALFLPGVELSKRFYRDVVAPLLESVLPELVYSAALIGPGSEVLGFDTKRSMDHDWGPRLQLFLHAADCKAHAQQIAGALEAELPPSFLGHSLRFGAGGSHAVVVTDLGTWCARELGFDPRADVSLLDWLATPTQRLAEAIGGAVFHDGLGELGVLRERLRWYPQQVWLYVLACQWARIGQEEAFVGRCLELSEARGARVVSARLMRDLMRLQLLMQRRYPPYSKWLGSAFAALNQAESLDPEALLDEQKLRHAYVSAAATFNGLGLTAPVSPAPRRFHDRPYWVLGAGRFVEALRGRITDPRIAALPPLGAIDQFIDSHDLLIDIPRCRAVTAAALGLSESEQ